MKDINTRKISIRKKSNDYRLCLGFGILILLLSFVLCRPTEAGLATQPEWGASIGSGHGVSNIVPIRLGVQRNFDCKWPLRCDWMLTGYFEASYYYLHGDRDKRVNSNDRLSIVAVAPVLRFQREIPVLSTLPYIDIGIGASWVSKKEIGGRELGIHFQFEDRLGFGFRFGPEKQFDFSYRVIHFSNAFLGQKNHGINLHFLMLGYWF